MDRLLVYQIVGPSCLFKLERKKDDEALLRLSATTDTAETGYFSTDRLVGSDWMPFLLSLSFSSFFLMARMGSWCCETKDDKGLLSDSKEFPCEMVGGMARESKYPNSPVVIVLLYRRYK
eukprot:scaffold56372_cov74-Attheya_sp.AAC.1